MSSRRGDNENIFDFYCDMEDPGDGGDTCGPGGCGDGADIGNPSDAGDSIFD